MYKKTAKHRRSHNSDYDIQADLVNIKNALRDTTHDIKGRAIEIAEQTYADAAERAARADKIATAFVAKKPYKTVGAAVLVGAALGWLWTRNH